MRTKTVVQNMEMPNNPSGRRSITGLGGLDHTRPKDSTLLFNPPVGHQGYAVAKRGKLISERPFYYYGTAYEQAAVEGGYVVTWEHMKKL